MFPLAVAALGAKAGAGAGGIAGLGGVFSKLASFGGGSSDTKPVGPGPVPEAPRSLAPPSLMPYDRSEPQLSQIAGMHMKRIQMEHAALNNNFSEYMSNEINSIFQQSDARHAGIK